MTRKKGKVQRKGNDPLVPTPALIDEIVGNEDLLTEILLRVPARSLIRFKCVSKYWLKLISDVQFCYSHSARNPKVISTIYYHSDSSGISLIPVSLEGQKSSPSISFLGLVNGAKPQFEHCCNGLMLCSYNNQREFSVCNLTTQKVNLLPKLICTTYYFTLSCLAFDPAKSPEYKVVLIRTSSNSGSYEILIYSSKNTSWSCIQVDALPGACVPYAQKAFWDGAIHWMTYGDSHIEFNVDEEKLIVSRLPPKPTILCDFEIHYFGECGGNLLLIQYRTRTILGFRILEMKRGTRHWVVKQRANLRPILEIYPDPGKYKFHVVSAVKGSRESDVVLVLASASHFLAYDLKSKVVEVLCDFSPRQFESFVFYRIGKKCNVHQFFESLAPV